LKPLPVIHCAAGLRSSTHDTYKYRDVRRLVPVPLPLTAIKFVGTIGFAESHPMLELQRDVGTTPRTLLIIDDDGVQRTVLGKVGTKAGYAVTTVATLEEAITEVGRQHFDCIVLDLLLNGQNGMLTLGEIVKFNRDTLLIIISSASEAVREQTRALAAHQDLDVVDLPKPVDLTVLRTLLTTDLRVAQPA
jgi:CheY-like chemotaxis protein